MATASPFDRYRLRDDVRCQGNLLVSLRPLTVSRLNSTGSAIASALSQESFTTPETLGDETGQDVETVANFLDRLHDRGFLDWRPGRDDSSRPPVSVVVTVRNGSDHLEGCMDALAALTYPDYEVVLVDGGSTDGTVETATTHRLATSGTLRVVEVGSADDPLGIGASRNRGVEAATNDVVAFTDADCRPSPTWLSDLVPYLAGTDVVGGRIRPHDEDSVSGYEGHHSSLDMGDRPEHVDPTGGTPYLPTANLIAHREVLEAVGFSSQNVGEDVDFCWRANDAGYDIVYVPTGSVEHDYRKTLKEFSSRRSDYGGSEALLSRASTDGTRVPIRLVPALLLALALFAVFGTVTWQPEALVFATGLGTVLGARGVLTYLGIRSAVPVGAYLGSRARAGLSGLYALAREVSRYYSLPLCVVAVGCAVAGAVTTATILGVGLTFATAYPIGTDYVVRRPELSVSRYVFLSVLDDVSYQVGAYRGAVRYGAAGHLTPWNRFRVTIA